jgi:phytoene dehydrogenase-like protein
MKPRQRPGVYARTLETTLARLPGRPWTLSRRDWALAAKWCERALPLALIVETLERAAERARRRNGDPPRSLAYISAAVEESWAVISHGRAADPANAGAADEPAALATVWEAAAARLEQDSPRLADRLRELARRLAAGEAADELDGCLDATLLADVEPARIARLRSAIEAELEPFRERMSQEQLESTRERVLLDRLRRELGFPRAHGG